MMRIVLLMSSVIFLIGCGDADKIAQLEKEIASNKQELARQQADIADKDAKLTQAAKDLAVSGEKNETSAAKAKELEVKLDKFKNDLGKDGLILPVYLIGKPIVIYTKPYNDIGIFIGVIKEIKQNDKIVLELSQPNKSIDIKFDNIIGYRIQE